MSLFTENFEKYEDPQTYDVLNRFDDDLKVIEQWLPEQNEPVIELACGTGRLTIPLALKGWRITGVDLHEGMLGLAKEKAQMQGAVIDWHLQDCTKLELQVKSRLIFMTGNSFQHFLTNEMQDQLLSSVRKHLLPGGHFIFDTRNPVLKELASPDEYEETYINAAGEQVAEKHWEEYNFKTQILDCRTERTRISKDGAALTEKDRIRLRYVFPLEMERLLSSHGFEAVHIYGDWKQNPLAEESPQMIYICRMKGQ